MVGVDRLLVSDLSRGQADRASGTHRLATAPCAISVICRLASLGREASGSVPQREAFAWAPWEFWAAALITTLGLLFTVWARIHLGRNWSGTVTIKRDHELIASGPYAIVRHPIYTGLIVAFIGSAMARGEWCSVLAVFIAWAALWRKLRLEERWMVERFGEQYIAYSRRVPALVPFSKWGKP
jgi:protein-S-isoprenylcysteine O-methyltransferase Ste14